MRVKKVSLLLLLTAVMGASLLLLQSLSSMEPGQSQEVEVKTKEVMTTTHTLPVLTQANHESSSNNKETLAEVYHGTSLQNEYILVPYVRFTQDRIYLINPGLGKRVVEKPIGFKKKELNEVIDYALSQLNSLNSGPGHHPYTKSNLVEGIYRTVPMAGTQYELYFTNSSTTAKKESLIKLSIFLPFADFKLTHVSTSRSKPHINLILPLSGRLESFHKFMSRYEAACISHDGHVSLTVVYFGGDGLDEVELTTQKLLLRHPRTVINIISLNEPFSRARGLEAGANAWTEGDVLLFLCDVDIAFSTDFLGRCRSHTAAGHSVYFPIVFSLYNPKVVYKLQDKAIPPEAHQFVISKNTGWWRDFGYGMACVYRSDLAAVHGFEEKVEGWGMEDVRLYRKFLLSPLKVVRATDPGLFHVWHEKHCDPHLAPDQYKACLHSKAINEASHAHLGLLAFKDEVDVHINTHKNTPRTLPLS